MTRRRHGQLVSLLCCLWERYWHERTASRCSARYRDRLLSAINVVNARLESGCEEIRRERATAPLLRAV